MDYFGEIVKNHLKAIIYITDLKGKIEWISQNGVHLLDFNSADDLVGRNIKEFHKYSEDYDLLIGRLLRNRIINDFEVYYVTKKNREIICLEHAVIRDDPNDKSPKIYAIGLDINDRVTAQTRLIQANMELLNANEEIKKTQVSLIQQQKMAALGHLAAGVAHEINNPLSFIKSNVGTINKYTQKTLLFLAEIKNLEKSVYPQEGETTFIDRPADSENVIRAAEIIKDLIEKYNIEEVQHDAQVIIQEIQEGIERISEIIATLGLFKRQAGTMEGENKAFCDLDKALQDALRLTERVKSPATKVRLKKNGMLYVKGMHKVVVQVLVNLLDNAFYAARQVGKNKNPQVLIETFQEDEYGIITISNNGQHVPDAVLSSMFQPFFTTKGPNDGKGLGLSICYHIVVQQLKGDIAAKKIKVEAGPQEFTRLVVKIPLYKVY